MVPFMSKIIRFSLIGVLLLTTLFSIGCQTTLAPGGAYNGDVILYQTDKAITTAYTNFDEFLKFELQFRSSLPVEVSRVADTIRKNAQKWISSAQSLREAYAADPSIGNKDKLSTAVNVIQAALSESAKYMKTYKPKTSSINVDSSWSWLMPASPLSLSVR